MPWALYRLIHLPDEERVVLRFKASNVEPVVSRLDSDLAESAGGRNLPYRRAVGDADGIGPVLALVVGGNLTCIRHHHGGEAGSQKLRQVIPAAGRPIPFLAKSLDSVDVERNGHTGEAGSKVKTALAALIEDRIVAVEQQMRGADGGMCQRIEEFIADGGEPLKGDAAVLPGRVFLTAVNGDGMTPFDQARA